MEPKSGIVNIDSKLHINEIDFFFTPRKKIFQEIYIPQGEPEMTALESGFLCGCLKKYKPQKILEIGIAAGATTAIILECMESLGLDYEMHSIDYLEYFYRDKQKKSGYLAEDLIKRNIPRILRNLF